MINIFNSKFFDFFLLSAISIFCFLIHFAFLGLDFSSEIDLKDSFKMPIGIVLWKYGILVLWCLISIYLIYLIRVVILQFKNKRANFIFFVSGALLAVLILLIIYYLSSVHSDAIGGDGVIYPPLSAHRAEPLTEEQKGNSSMIRLWICEAFILLSLFFSFLKKKK